MPACSRVGVPVSEAGPGLAVYLAEDSRQPEPLEEGRFRRDSCGFWTREPWSVWLRGGHRNQHRGTDW